MAKALRNKRKSRLAAKRLKEAERQWAKMESNRRRRGRGDSGYEKEFRPKRDSQRKKTGSSGFKNNAFNDTSWF
jgi:hypothetical protein